MTDSTAPSKATIDQYFHNGLDIASKYLIPAASIALPFVGGPAGIALGLSLQALPVLIGLAQNIPEAKGDQKFAFVSATLQGVAQTVEAASTGGQKDTWNQIGVILGKLTNTFVAAANAHAAALATDPTTVKPAPGPVPVSQPGYTASAG